MHCMLWSCLSSHLCSGMVPHLYVSRPWHLLGVLAKLLQDAPYFGFPDVSVPLGSDDAFARGGVGLTQNEVKAGMECLRQCIPGLWALAAWITGCLLALHWGHSLPPIASWGGFSQVVQMPCHSSNVTLSFSKPLVVPAKPQSCRRWPREDVSHRMPCWI